MAGSRWSSLVLGYRFFLFVQAAPPMTLTPDPLASQGQLVTSYAPVLTICPISNSSPSLAGSPNGPAKASTPGPVIQRRQHAIKYYGNFSVAASPQDECSTSYSSTLTQSCATKLTPVGAPLIPITACDQEVTFSTDHGYRLAPTSTDSGICGGGGGEIETLTTFYVAGWTDVATGLPRGQVKEEICSDAGCTTQLQRWIPVTTETLQIHTSTVQFTGVLSTPAQVVAGSITLTALPNEDRSSSISLSTVIEITQTVPRTAISISTVSQPAATSYAINTDRIGDDGDDYTTTTTSTSTLTQYRTIQSASVTQAQS